MDIKKQKERIIKSSHIALEQLDKLITQNIDLANLDPEKAKAAAQGKIEAIEGSLKILQVIEEIQNMDEELKDNKQSFFGVEGRVKNV